MQETLPAVDRNYQVELARQRMLFAKIKETEEGNVSTSVGKTKKPKLPAFEDSLDDGTGGVWHLTEGNKWDYDCTGLMCHKCAYHKEYHCLICSPVTEEERDIQIKSAKERMKK